MLDIADDTTGRKSISRKLVFRAEGRAAISFANAAWYFYSLLES
jgi:hypothetical protein